MKRLIAIATVATIAASTFFVSSVSAQTPNFLEPNGQFGEWTEVSTEALRDEFTIAGGLTTLEMHNNQLWAFGTINYDDPAIFYSDGEDWVKDTTASFHANAYNAVSSAVVEETLFVLIDHTASTETQLWFHTAANGWQEDESFDAAVSMYEGDDIVTSGDELCISGNEFGGELALVCGGPDNWSSFDLAELGSQAQFGGGGDGIAIVGETVVMAAQFPIEDNWVSALYTHSGSGWDMIIDSNFIGADFNDDYWSAITPINDTGSIYAQRHSESAQVTSTFAVDIEDAAFTAIGDEENFGVSGDVRNTRGLWQLLGLPYVSVDRDGVGEFWIAGQDAAWQVVNDNDDFSDGVSAPDRIDDVIFVQMEAVFVVTNYSSDGIERPRIWLFTGFGEPPETTTTTAPVADSDGDTVSDDIENAGPNGGDANADGTDDSQQSEVSTFINPLTGQYASLAVSSDTECSIDNASIGPESTENADNEFSYPNGLMNFSIDCNGEGATATVQLTFFDAGEAKDFIGRKFLDNSYLTLNGASVEDVTVGDSAGVRMTYSLVDGGQLDADGEANGVIVDPAGLGTVAASGSLPSTGSNPIFLVSTGLILVIGGALFVRRSRRTSLI